MFEYLLFLLLLLPCLAFAAWASARVNSTYAKYDRVQTRSCMTGYDTATRLMRNRGVSGIAVNRVEGRLTDHYNPSKKVVNLSMSTYGSASVAAVAVAAHEVGHVMQKQTGYIPYKIRNVLVPLTNIGSRLALPVILVRSVASLMRVYPWSMDVAVVWLSAWHAFFLALTVLCWYASYRRLARRDLEYCPPSPSSAA